MDKYKEMIEQAAAEYATANEDYKAVATVARDAQAELSSINVEIEAIQKRIADFEAGRVGLEAAEYIELEDRRRYLAIRAKQQAAISQTAAGKVELKGALLSGVGSKYRNMLEKVLAEDARATATARRAELEAVLRG